MSQSRKKLSYQRDTFSTKQKRFDGSIYQEVISRPKKKKSVKTKKKKSPSKLVPPDISSILAKSNRGTDEPKQSKYLLYSMRALQKSKKYRENEIMSETDRRDIYEREYETKHIESDSLNDSPRSEILDRQAFHQELSSYENALRERRAYQQLNQLDSSLSDENAEYDIPSFELKQEVTPADNLMKTQSNIESSSRRQLKTPPMYAGYIEDTDDTKPMRIRVTPEREEIEVEEVGPEEKIVSNIEDKPEKALDEIPHEIPPEKEQIPESHKIEEITQPTKSRLMLALDKKMLETELDHLNKRLLQIKEEHVGLSVAIGRMENEQIINENWLQKEKTRMHELSRISADISNEIYDEDYELDSEEKISAMVFEITKMKNSIKLAMDKLKKIVDTIYYLEDEKRRKHIEKAHIKQMLQHRITFEQKWTNEAIAIQNKDYEDLEKLRQELEKVKNRNAEAENALEEKRSQGRQMLSVIQQVVNILKGREDTPKGYYFSLIRAIDLYTRLKEAVEQDKFSIDYMIQFLRINKEFGIYLPFTSFANK